MTWLVEYTDTFGGEANYCWVRRYNIGTRDSDAIATTGSCETQRMILKRAKAAAGLTGVRGRTSWFGDSFEFRPYHSCTILMGNWCDCYSDEELSERGYDPA